MNKTISLILLLLIGFGVCDAAADNSVKTSFATVTLPDGWYLIKAPEKESKEQVTFSDVTISQKKCMLVGPKSAQILLARYDTGKTADMDAVKAYIERMQEDNNRERISNLKWEFDESRDMWTGTDIKITASNSEEAEPDFKVARKDVIHLLRNGKYIDVFWVHLTFTAVSNSKISGQIDSIFNSWTPKGIKRK